MSTPITEEHKYAVNWWKSAHGNGSQYFPKMQQHWNWKIYTRDDLWLKDTIDLSPKDVCLEIGCGYGQWMIPLSKLVGKVHGFDIHPHLGEVASQKFEEHEVNNCEMRIGDGFSIPYTDPIYTVVYSISVFQHMPRSAAKNYMELSRDLALPGATGMFHFRHATPNFADGPYSKDIEVQHRGDWSVGWTKEQCEEAANETGWGVIEARVQGQSVMLITTNP